MRSSRNGVDLQRIYLRAYLLLPQIWCANAYMKYLSFCSMANQPTVYVNASVMNNETTNYTVVNSDGGVSRRSLKAGPTREDGRFLANIETFKNETEEQTYPVVRISTETVESNLNPGSSEVFMFRECPCSSKMQYSMESYKYYCPVNLKYCALPGASRKAASELVCLNIQNDEEVFVQSVWPIIVIWYALTFSFCICTWAGRNACDYTISFFFPCWNKALFSVICPQAGGIESNNRFLRSFFHQRREFIQDRYQRYRRTVERSEEHEGDVLSYSSEYELRTRTIKLKKEKLSENSKMKTTTETPAPNSEEDPLSCDMLEDNNASPSCAICFLNLEDGDRVGAIDCGHLFHVDCLKGWLIRRNVCPLCLHEGIAKPKGQHQLQRLSSPQTRGPPL